MPLPRTDAGSQRVALESLRGQLLDISKRNRLLNTPLHSTRAKQLRVVEERSDALFHILVREGRKMTFLPSREADDAVSDGDRIRLPDDAAPTNGDFQPHHLDRKLQTPHGPEKLQRKLLALYRDARTVEEEQGVSVLFLALGFLRWREAAASSVERFAPLLLIPVDLDRSGVRGRFRIAVRDQDLEANLSLGAMLQTDFGLVLPDLPEDEDWLPTAYFDRVRGAVSTRPGWEVLPDEMVLGPFSFAKFLMWRDLSPDAEWQAGEGPNGNPLVDLLLEGGETPGSSGAPGDLDEEFDDPREIGHILDADASQTRVIAAADAGRSLVVQGPPGTGKSQTITNIVATSVRAGKRVLFVAEKRAALDVVHDRLQKAGLGPLCLELHSHKANRKKVYEELRRTLAVGQPQAVTDEAYARLKTVRDDLNRTDVLLHEVDRATGETPFLVLGVLSKLIGERLPRPDFRIPGSDTWDPGAFAERIEAVERLADLTGRLGSEREHVWRGARRRLDPIQRGRLGDRLTMASDRLGAFRDSLHAAAAAVGVGPVESSGDAAGVLDALDALTAMPERARELLPPSLLARDPELVLHLAKEIAGIQALVARLRDVVVESAFETRWHEVRVEIAAHGNSFLGRFRGSCRRAVDRLRGVMADGRLPRSHEGRLTLLDQLLEHRRRAGRIRARRRLGEDAFGDRWAGAETEVAELIPALEWFVSSRDRTPLLRNPDDPIGAVPTDTDFAAVARRLGDDLERWTEAWEKVAQGVELVVPEAFGAEEVDAVPIARIGSRLDAWATGIEALPDWIQLENAGRAASDLGLDPIRERLGDGRLSADDAEGVLRFVRAESVWRRMTGEHPELAALDGEERSARVAEFRDLDRTLQQLAAQEVAIRHYESLPTGSAGQIGIVRGETAKKIRHLRLRKLLDTAGEAVATIKPVFLMSPLSVAQYLSPGGLTFDLVLIDEASQVRPADAMGAVLRGRQIVVVGDQHQLPPTSFFDRQVAGDDEAPLDDEEEIRAAQLGAMESILSLCEARALPGGMLRWHYRSRHPSLIQVSNLEFYEEKLICPPSPDHASGASGLRFTPVEGEYQRGRKRDNPKEADAIAAAVLAHARERPDTSLGVVALSVAQRDCILNRIEWMRGEHPELEAFCRGSREESFFVKNLENVQGDERDVIFISIGYGKDAKGYMSQSFGPVSSEGGERRLNVLFTRAKRECRIFSSIRFQDIRLDAIKRRGPRVLRRFLKFAETGDLDIPLLTERGPDSPFEEAVAKAIRDHGYEVSGQVGSAGFLIDLAIHDPDHEGRFLLAVECDGARYHSSSWARERDRSRQEVLEAKGWRFHRIWSTDWFQNRETEVSRLLDAAERARGASPGEPAPPSGLGPVAPNPAAPTPGVVRAPPAPERIQPRPPEPGPPYEEASLEIADPRIPIHEAASNRIARCVVAVVRGEGPVHRDLVAERISRAWGNRRIGSRIRGAVDRGIETALRGGRIRPLREDAEEFLASTDEAPDEALVRDRSRCPAAAKKVSVIPPTEIQAAILRVVEASIGIGMTECAIPVARLFGFKRTPRGMKPRVEEQARRLVEAGRLARQRGELRIPADIESRQARALLDRGGSPTLASPEAR